MLHQTSTRWYGRAGDIEKLRLLVLAPLVGRTEHHVKNSKDFVRDIREIRVEPDKELQSYDVSALFTSVPLDKALDH